MWDKAIYPFGVVFQLDLVLGGFVVVLTPLPKEEETARPTRSRRQAAEAKKKRLAKNIRSENRKHEYARWLRRGEQFSS